MRQFSEDIVKNFFYSHQKRLLRQMNKCFKTHKKEFRSLRDMSWSLLSKVLALCQNRYESKVEITEDIPVELVEGISSYLSQIKETFLSFLKNDGFLSEEDLYGLVKKVSKISSACRKKKKFKLHKNYQCKGNTQRKRNQIKVLEKTRKEQLWQEDVKVFPKTQVFLKHLNSE